MSRSASGPVKPLITICLSIAVFGWLLPRLGMALSLPILIVICSLAGDEFHWKDVLINCIVLTVGSLGDLHRGPEADDSAVADVHRRQA